VAAIAALSGFINVSAGELDASQARWLKHYEKQANLPKPAAMLVNTNAEPDLNDGFVALFNGSDLTGWVSRGGTSKFAVKEGCIVGTCVADVPSTYLCTERSDYRDFVFTAETKMEVEINSGIMFRANLTGAQTNTVTGPQVEMEPLSQDREWSGGIYGQDCGGWFYPVWLKEHAAARQAQTSGWNRITIEARGDTVKTWLNGVPVAHWKSDKFHAGCFGLQIHKAKQGVVLWRKVKLKEL